MMRMAAFTLNKNIDTECNNDSNGMRNTNIMPAKSGGAEANADDGYYETTALLTLVVS